MSIPVLEWTPNGCRALDPATGKTAQGSAQEALAAIGKPRKVGLLIGRRFAFVRTARLPDVAKEQALAALQLQLDRYFPTGADETAYDIRPQDDVSHEGRRWLLVGVKNEALRQARSELKAAGASAEWTSVTSLGAPIIAADQLLAEAVIVEDTQDGCAFDAVDQAGLAYSRVAPTRSDRDAEAARTAATAGIQNPQVVNSDAETSALAAIARSYPADIDLRLPEERLKQANRKIQGRRRWSIFLWCIALVMAALVWLDFGDSQDQIAKAEQAAEAEVKPLEDNVTRLAAMTETSGLTAEAIDRAFFPAQGAGDVATIVSNSVPPGVWLTGMTFDRGRPLQLRGTAKANADVAQFVTNLSLTSRLRDVKIVFANDAKIDDTAVVQYSISAHVIGNLPLEEKSR